MFNCPKCGREIPLMEDCCPECGVTVDAVRKLFLANNAADAKESFASFKIIATLICCGLIAVAMLYLFQE